MTYGVAIQFLYGLQMFGAKPGLERTIKLCALADNPERKLRFIHVAGTNGKGSTCAMLESIYRTAGFRVGLFTSPHLVSFRERIQVNRQLISEADVARLAAEQVECLKTFKAEEHPTMFEVVTVMALRYFAEQNCDLVILETGLGGRLDATNVITPLASVITSIGVDHEQWLGNTLALIAAEKGGIIKPNVPVLTVTQAEAAQAVIAAIARDRGVPLTVVTERDFPDADLQTPLLGTHQKQNAALSIATVQALQNSFPVKSMAIKAGLRAVNWPGRLQLIEQPTGRRILLDGAHNEAGVAVLLSALRKHFPGTKPTLILGMLGDKQWREMSFQLAPIAGRVFTVPVASARSVPAADLAEVFCWTKPDSARACSSLRAAIEATASESFVLITGSLYLVGEALELLRPGQNDTFGERGLNEWKPTSSG